MSIGKPLCFRCGELKELHRVGYSYCLKCQYKFSVEAYKKKPYSTYSEEKKKQFRCRGAVFTALKSGKLIKQPCEVCNEPKTEAHHEDYSKPLEVKWLCRKHHFEIHGHKPKKRAKRKPSVRLLQPRHSSVFHVEHSAVMAVLRAKLAKEADLYRHWSEYIKHKQNKTRQKDVERKFNKRIQAFKITIHALTPFFEREEDIPTFVVRKDKKPPP